MFSGSCYTNSFAIFVEFISINSCKDTDKMWSQYFRILIIGDRGMYQFAQMTNKERQYQYAKDMINPLKETAIDIS